MWRKLTEDDLVATLSRAEVDAFKNDFEIEAVEKLLIDVTAEVRGFIDSGRKCRMDPDEATLPAMLKSAAMDYMAFKLLKRLDIVPNEARTKAYDRACDLFEKVARGEIVPPDYGTPATDDTKQVATSPTFSPAQPARLLD